MFTKLNEVVKGDYKIIISYQNVQSEGNTSESKNPLYKFIIKNVKTNHTLIDGIFSYSESKEGSFFAPIRSISSIAFLKIVFYNNIDKTKEEEFKKNIDELK
ncbi:MAG: hypothetical protein ACP5T6_03705, partial [Candidatus Micrarchaeia archaeon]